MSTTKTIRLIIYSGPMLCGLYNFFFIRRTFLKYFSFYAETSRF